MDKSGPEEWNPLSDILFVRNSFDEKWSHGVSLKVRKCLRVNNIRQTSQNTCLNLLVALARDYIYWDSYDFL